MTARARAGRVCQSAGASENIGRMKLQTSGLALLMTLAAWLPAASQEPAAPVVPAYNIEIVIFRAAEKDFKESRLIDKL